MQLRLGWPRSVPMSAQQRKFNATKPALYRLDVPVMSDDLRAERHGMPLQQPVCITMTHRPYTPPAWQAKPLADGRVTLLVVPLRPQPYALDYQESGHRTWNASGQVGGRICMSDSDLLDLHRKPAPGDLIWCRETYIGPYAYEVNEYKPKDWGNKPSWFPADGPIPERFVGQFWHKARSPVTMPKWAARTWLRCTGVEVRRVQTISEDEVRRVGLEPNDGTVLRGKFNPWDANPWCAFTTVEKISKEDV